MASLIQSKKKSDFKKECAYFDLRLVLEDSEAGTSGLERGICRNKFKLNPASCKGCDQFSKTPSVMAPLPDDMEGGDLLRLIENDMLDVEASDLAKKQAEKVWNNSRDRLKNHMEDLGKTGVDGKRCQIGNKKVTIAERFTDKWIPEVLKERLTSILKGKNKKYLKDIYPKKLHVQSSDSAEIKRVVEALDKMGLKNTKVWVTDEFDESKIDNLVAAEIIERDQLTGTYESKKSSWPLVKTVKQAEVEEERMIII